MSTLLVPRLTIPEGDSGRDHPYAQSSLRRGLRWMLGLVWLLDGGLQFQPYMFTAAFPDQTLRSAGQGSPSWVSAPVNWSASLMGHDIVVFNSLFAVVQVLIALGLFWRRTVRLALAASIMWAVMVWWLGEALGGVLAGPVSPLMGFPGAVIVYALIAVLIWPSRAGAAMAGRSVAEASPLTPVGAKVLWVVFWASFVFEALRPANRARSALHDIVIGAGAGEPRWLKSMNGAGARLLAGHGAAVSIGLAAIFAIVALGVFLPVWLGRSVLVLAIIVALGIWVVAQDFGAIATGKATDVNSGLVVGLFALCYWPLKRSGPKTHSCPAPGGYEQTGAPHVESGDYTGVGAYSGRYFRDHSATGARVEPLGVPEAVLVSGDPGVAQHPAS